jgi:hypothetical protein
MSEKETTKQLLAEQRRTNELLERLVNRDPPHRKHWMCDAGRNGTCYGPFYICAIFGCASPSRRS